MRPFHKHMKNPAGLARPLANFTHLSKGHSFGARVIPGSVAGAEFKHPCGCDLPAREQPSELLRALIFKLLLGWMPCASVHA